MKTLPRVGPNGKPIATPSICLYKISLKLKYYSLATKDNNSLNSDLFQPSTLSFSLYIDSVQTLIVSSSGMSVKSESTYNYCPYQYKSYCFVQQFLLQTKKSL